MRTGRSVVLVGPGRPLELRAVEIPEPGPGQLLVRVGAAGVCGTDAHRLTGDLPAAGYDACFGHEGVGEVVALGEGVSVDHDGTPIALGDQVSWAPTNPCGQCRGCLVDRLLSACEQLEWPARAGRANPACYQDYALLPPKTLAYRIPDEVDPMAVLALGCAMPTALGGFDRLGDVPPVVIVQGCGPVGLASTLLASLRGARTIIVIGDPESRLSVARRFGATETIPLTGTTAAERRDRVLDVTEGRGAGAVIEAAGHPSAFPEGFDLLGVNGRFLIMGLYSGRASAPLDPVRINNWNLHIIGSLGSMPSAYAQAVRIAAEHGERLRFTELVTHRFPLAQTEAAIRTAASGTSIKTVVQPSL